MIYLQANNSFILGEAFMKKKLIAQYMAVGTMLLMAMAAHAQVPPNVGWTTYELTVKRVMTKDANEITAVTTGGNNNCAADAWVVIVANEAQRNRAYATLLAAVVSGKKVKFWYTGCAAFNNYHGATAVEIYQ
jgi:hypothetical protein